MKAIELLPISKLKLLENNPRTITKEQMEKLCKSIQDDPDFLNARPILVNKTTERHEGPDGCLNYDKEILTVYAGNQRVRAAKKLKIKEIPCIVENDLCSEVVKKRSLLDNKTYGEFDWDMLANEFDIEMLIDCGFTADDLVGSVQDINTYDKEEDSQVLEPPKDPKTKPGDIYELGNHRLACGDSTNKNDVSLLINDYNPILMVTDPPYGVNYDPSWREGKVGHGSKKIKQRNIVTNDHISSWCDSIKLFQGSICYLWCAALFMNDSRNDLLENDFEIINQIIWNKNNFSISRGDYHWKHEPCWYAVKKGKNHNWQGSRKESTVWDIPSLQANKTDEYKTTHGTQKPIECMARPIRNNSAEGEGVYDPFLGSGTTLIACEKLNRICYGLEIDPAYCDVIVERWCRLTGKKAKRNGVEIDEL